MHIITLSSQEAQPADAKASFRALDQEPVGSLAWLQQGSDAALLVGNASNSSLQLWTHGPQMQARQSLHLYAAPGQVGQNLSWQALMHHACTAMQHHEQYKAVAWPVHLSLTVQHLPCVCWLLCWLLCSILVGSVKLVSAQEVLNYVTVLEDEQLVILSGTRPGAVQVRFTRQQYCTSCPGAQAGNDHGHWAPE